VVAYATEQELAEYTRKSGKFVNKEAAYSNGLLMYLLREIVDDYYGDRPGGVGSKRGVGGVRVDLNRDQRTEDS